MKQKANSNENKHLAFLNSNILKKIERDSSPFIGFLSRFKPVPKDKFDEYYNYFKAIFKIGNASLTIVDFTPPSFLIYDKFQDFQKYLSLRNELFVKPATGAEPSKTYQNKIRIYPAIDSNQKFYLVLMGEQQDLTTATTVQPVTDRSIYYGIKDDVFDMIPIGERQQAEIDIHNFQTIWNNINDPAHPTYLFDPIHSFSYSIEEYNELLSDTIPFWDWRSYQTDANPKKLVKVYPIVIVDETEHVSFKLAFLPYTRRTIGGDLRDNSRSFFDHMDVCPDKCPSNEV